MLEREHRDNYGILRFGSEIRVSDKEREAVLDTLREACAEGRLTPDEFSERMNGVLATKNKDGLDYFTKDLPVVHKPQAPRGYELYELPGSQQPTYRMSKPSRWYVAFLWTALFTVVSGAIFGIYCFISWTTTPTPPLTPATAYHEGYLDGLSDQGYTHYPFGKYSCVSDWNTNAGANIASPSGQSAGFSNGGPSSHILITLKNENTHSVVGNAWMAGCQAALKSYGE